MTEPVLERESTWLYQFSRWHGWVPLGITVLIIAVGISLFKRAQETELAAGSNAQPNATPRGAQPRILPPRIRPGNLPELHSVVLDEIDGRQVYRIRVVPGGDELIIVAATGKLQSVHQGTGEPPQPPVALPVLN